MDDERNRWRREFNQQVAKGMRQQSRRRGLRRLPSSEFARATAASVLGTALFALAGYLIAVAVGAIQGVGKFGLALLITAVGSFLFAIGMIVFVDPSTLAQEEAVRLWEEGKRQGWLPDEPEDEAGLPGKGGG
jgi:hypothetical protein